MRVVQLGDPILRQKADHISKENIYSKEIGLTIQRMQSIMMGLKQISPRHGNGLAAPQVGDCRRLIVVFFENNFHTMINPEIMESSDDILKSFEGCLSFFYIRAPVIRNKSVKVKYINEQGKEISKEFRGDLSALIQHEIDHLDGILYIDRIEDNSDIYSIHHLLRDDTERLSIITKMIYYLTETDDS